MVLFPLEKDWARGGVSSGGIKVGGVVWWETCPDASVLHSKDLEVVLWEKETSDQTRTLKPWVRAQDPGKKQVQNPS